MMWPGLYFPPVAWVAAVWSIPKPNVCTALPYAKRSLQARCYIQSPNGPLRLTVPVIHASRQASDAPLLIDHSKPWAELHIRSIENYYRSAAYFPYYWPDYRALLEAPPHSLADLNAAVLRILSSHLCPEREWLNLRVSPGCHFDIPPSHYWTLQRHCQPENWAPEPYYQLFDGTEPNLSVLDLLFNLGPEARLWLSQHSGTA